MDTRCISWIPGFPCLNNACSTKSRRRCDGYAGEGMINRATREERGGKEEHGCGKLSLNQWNNVFLLQRNKRRTCLKSRHKPTSDPRQKKRVNRRGHIGDGDGRRRGSRGRAGSSTGRRERSSRQHEKRHSTRSSSNEPVN